MGRCHRLKEGVVKFMNGRKVISTAAVLMLAMAGILGSVRPAAASTTYTKLLFTPNPVAADGQLSPGATVTLCVQPEQGGIPVSGQSVNLSFATKYTPTAYIPNSSATATDSNGTKSLNSSPTTFLADQTCNTLVDAVSITYTAPSAYPMPLDGLDQIAAVNPAELDGVSHRRLSLLADHEIRIQHRTPHSSMRDSRRRPGGHLHGHRRGLR